MPPRKKNDADKAIQTANGAGEPVMVWKATRPLTQDEYEQLSDKLRREQEQSGIKIVLVPHMVEVDLLFFQGTEVKPEVSTDKEQDDDPAAAGDNQ